MSEPLTKGTFKKSSQKPLTRNDIHIVSDDREDFQIQVVTLENLKSALEEFERRLNLIRAPKNSELEEYKTLINEWAYDSADNPSLELWLLKKAFPAIYEVEK